MVSHAGQVVLTERALPLRGIRHIANDTRPSSEIEVARGYLHVAIRHLGRPQGSGRWANTDELREAILAAMRYLRTRKKKITQPTVGEVLADRKSDGVPTPGVDARQVREWISHFGLNWDNLRNDPAGCRSPETLSR